MDSDFASAVDTSLLGHSYYGDNRSIINDIFLVVRSSATPDERPGMIRLERAPKPYWKFRP